MVLWMNNRQSERESWSIDRQWTARNRFECMEWSMNFDKLMHASIVWEQWPAQNDCHVNCTFCWVTDSNWCIYHRKCSNIILSYGFGMPTARGRVFKVTNFRQRKAFGQPDQKASKHVCQSGISDVKSGWQCTSKEMHTSPVSSGCGEKQANTQAYKHRHGIRDG